MANWKQVVDDLRTKAGLTLQEIGDAAGITRSSTHSISNGETARVYYETGVALLELHRKEMRRVARRRKTPRKTG